LDSAVSAVYKDGSLANLEFRVERRINLKTRTTSVLEVSVEKAMHAIRRNRELAATVDMKPSEQAEPSPHDAALQ
jgi:hypothetical protein